MQPEDWIRCYRRMAALLNLLVYNFELGPLGPAMLDAAVQSWLKRARYRRVASGAYRRVLGFLRTLNPQPSLGPKRGYEWFDRSSAAPEDPVRFT